MKIKEKILEILNDNKQHYYKDIANELYSDSDYIAGILSKLKKENMVKNPIVELKITKRKSGWFVICNEK